MPLVSVRHLLAICLVTACLQATAQPTDNQQATESMSAKEQNEYSERLRNASSEQEREQIRAQHQQQSTRGSAGPAAGSSPGYGSGQGGTKHGAGQPAGNKNKPQKSGKK